MSEQEMQKKPGCGVFVICWIVGTIVIYIAYFGDTPSSAYSSTAGGTIALGHLAGSAGPGAIIGTILFVIVRAIVASSNKK
jgi:hypothetical protein